jgi:hypothetical protein
MRLAFWPRLPRILLIALAIWFVYLFDRGAAVPAPPVRESVVDLKVVKYNGLIEAVKAQHGKVVVVDVWGEF